MCHEVASEFFATNALDPPRWALNSCFGASHIVWMHFGLFRYYTKLDTKRAELVQLKQKFVPRSRIRIFHNERTRYTPLDHKLMFFVRFVVFGCICQCSVTTRNLVPNGLNWCNQCTSLSHKIASEFFASDAPNPPPLDPKLMFWCVG